MAKGYYVSLARVVDYSTGQVDKRSRIGGSFSKEHYILRATDGNDELAINELNEGVGGYLELLGGKLLVPFIGAVVEQSYRMQDMIGLIDASKYNPRKSDGLHLIDASNVMLPLNFEGKKQSDRVAAALNDLSKHRRKY